MTALSYNAMRVIACLLDGFIIALVITNLRGM